DSVLKRAAVSVFMIAAMAYAASAPTLSQLSSTVVNITTLRPATTYPFITGLRFVPCFVLLLLFWVMLGRYGDAGFARDSLLGRAYIWFGVAFLSATIHATARAFGDYEIWFGMLPERRVLLIGYFWVLIANIAVWFLSFRWFRKPESVGYLPLFVQC